MPENESVTTIGDGVEETPDRDLDFLRAQRGETVVFDRTVVVEEDKPETDA